MAGAAATAEVGTESEVGAQVAAGVEVAAGVGDGELSAPGGWAGVSGAAVGMNAAEAEAEAGVGVGAEVKCGGRSGSGS
ncbi:hypothetical protein ACFWNE_00265 [Streptomyces goshikiensis]|uniref:hypothetical protein n=1 Tax=Streptomyces goshikiensis TaxID=1942 RepID=UPI0036594027